MPTGRKTPTQLNSYQKISCPVGQIIHHVGIFYLYLVYIWKLSLRSFDPPLVTLSCRFLLDSVFLDQWLHELSPNDFMPNQRDKAGVMAQEFLWAMQEFRLRPVRINGSESPPPPPVAPEIPPRYTACQRFRPR